MARIKKNVSLQNDVLEKGMKKANEMFAGNFSMYITYLINKDCKDIIEIDNSNINKNDNSNKLNIDRNVKDEIDNILNI